MKGWIKLHRGLADHFLWNSEPYSKGQAWVDLLLHANFTDNELMLKNEVLHIKRGQQARSELTLADEWKWSRGKVRRFLKTLQRHDMIEQQTGHLTSVISICNYDSFQVEGTTDGTALKTANGTTDEHLTVHSKELKNDNKVKKTTSVKHTAEDMTCAEYIFKGVKRLDPQKNANMQSWANTIRLMREVDKRPHKEICEVFKYANNNVRFWQRNVLSPESLRKNFMKIKLESESEGSKENHHHFDDNEYGQGGRI